MINFAIQNAILFIFGVNLSPGEANCSDNQACETGLPVVDASNGELQQILQIVFGIAAALAVLFIVIAGLRFITSQGNPQEVAKARNTIVYALVGLLVALSAEVIVSFVVVRL
jgi:type IV secretory pathway VirB2 component (pilin)